MDETPVRGGESGGGGDNAQDHVDPAAPEIYVAVSEYVDVGLHVL